MSSLATTDGANTQFLHFSQNVLDLQANSFCCSDTDRRKIIRWVGCQPSVFQSSQTLFSSKDLAMCSWFQTVADYNFVTVRLDPEETIKVDLYSAYVLAKAAWPSNALEEQKLIEVGIGEQPGFVGMTIPFMIGYPNTTTFKYMVMKDLFHINTNSLLTTPMWLNNISPYTVSVSILYAN
jgi:hypothetical protein